MADPRWEKLQAIFDAAVALPEAEREAYLDEACGDDGELRQEVEALLSADSANTSKSSSGNRWCEFGGWWLVVSSW